MKNLKIMERFSNQWISYGIDLLTGDIYYRMADHTEWVKKSTRSKDGGKTRYVQMGHHNDVHVRSLQKLYMDGTHNEDGTVIDLEGEIWTEEMVKGEMIYLSSNMGRLKSRVNMDEGGYVKRKEYNRGYYRVYAKRRPIIERIIKKLPFVKK